MCLEKLLVVKAPVFLDTMPEVVLLEASDGTHSLPESSNQSSASSLPEKGQGLALIGGTPREARSFGDFH
jgi:hypothetical protein